MNLKIIFAAATIAFVPHVSHATEIIGTRSGWEVFQDSKSCGMTRIYPGSGATEMMVLKYTGGDVRVMITNTGWSARQGELYDISYRLNGVAYGGSDAVGTADPVRRGFVSTFVDAFAEDLAKGSTLRVFLDGKEIERLSLRGTGAAMGLVDECLVKVRAALSAAEREQERRAKLPKDPFAPPPGTPVPIGDVDSWTAPDDYPRAALKEGREGVTAFRLKVGPNGRVTDCEVTKSSGHEDLDEAACENARRKARFKPATDARGEPVAATYNERVTWKLPED